MDETSRDKLRGAMCDLLSNVIHIADEGNYERDSFVKGKCRNVQDDNGNQHI